MRTQKHSFFVVLLCSTLRLFAQDPVEINVIPPSPTASSFQKYIDMPVSLYTGTPSIAIPITELKTGQLSVPVSLSYHASGLKVNERASWVGAGWTLNAGGAVSRSTKGLPDEINIPGKKGYFHIGYLFQSNGLFDMNKIYSCATPAGVPLTTQDGPYTRLDSLAQGMVDTEPDVYYYSSPGGSLKFTFDQKRNLVKYVNDDTKLLQHPFENIYNPGDTWVFKGADGVVYTFSHVETTEVTTACGSALSAYNPGIDFFANSWYLTSMSLNGDSIKFSYADEFVTYSDYYNESRKVKVSGHGPAGMSIDYCNTDTQVNAKRLSTITTTDGYELKFLAETSRNDLNGSKRLDKIELRKDGDLVQRYLLQYDYFGANTKLKLTNINELSSVQEDTDTLAGHAFEYFESFPVPPINSKAQDFWGYYNGANNSTLIPPFKNNLYHVNRTLAANRDPSLNYAKVGSLKKLIYPTSGYTEFDYELHTYHKEDHLVTFIKEASASGGDNNNPTSFETIFTLDAPTVATLTKTGEPYTFYSFATLKKWNGTSYVAYSPATNGGNRVNFAAGTYQLFAQSGEGGSVAISVEYELPIDSNLEAGGLRIKQVKHYDPILNKKLTKNYTYKFANGNSSGIHFSPMILGGSISTTIGGSIGGDAGQTCFPDPAGNFLSLSTFSQVPLAINHGSHIGYSLVKEIVFIDVEQQQIQSGLVEHSFVNVPDEYVYTYPFPSSSNMDLSYKNGKPLSKIVFATVSTGLEKLNEINYTYNELIPGNTARGLVVKNLTSRFCFQCLTSDYANNYYEIKTKWNYLSKQRTTEYKNGVPTLTKEIKYVYDTVAPFTHTLVMQEKWNDSRNIENLTTYTRMAENPELITTTEKFVNAVPVEKVMVNYLGKQLTNKYVWTDPTIGYVHEFHNVYNAKNKLIKRTNKPVLAPFTTQYIWAHNNTYPIAEITNTDRPDIFVSSFEDNAAATNENGPNKAHAGKKYWTGQFTFSDQGFIPVSTNDLIMSYWYWDSNTWKFRELPFANTINESRIDDIRVFPKGAFVKSLTYKNGVGVETITDQNNIIQYFKYDKFNRLEMVMDENKKVLQKNEYVYKQ